MTWLYGPLHVGADWQQTAYHVSPSIPARRLDSSANSSRAATPSGKKPILKHRSISELLSLPASPLFHNDEEEEETTDSSHHNDEPEHRSRPQLLHTKSDTHISWRSRPFRKDSPPRIIASDSQAADSDHLLNAPASSGSSNATGSDQDLTGNGTGKKKHISFNTFVEQYIAIEKPKPTHRGSTTHFIHDPSFDEGSVYCSSFGGQACTNVPTSCFRYDEDSEVGDEDESDEPSTLFINNPGGIDTDSEEDEDEDDDEVLEIRSRSSSSSGSRRPSMRTTSPPTAMSNLRPSLIRQSSVDREHVTIAPIAPTILKTTGVGNQFGSIGEDRSLSSQKEVDLVYAPPTHSIYSHPGTPSVHHEDVYHHRESYFSVGTGPTTSHTRSADSSPVLGTFTLPPIVRDPARQVSHGRDLREYFAQQSIYESPMHTDDVHEEDAYDYFGGPDLGEDYHRPSILRNRRSIPDVHDDDHGGGAIVRYGHGGASSVPTGRHNASWSPAVSSSPQIIVNEVAGAMEEREELSTGSSGSPSEVTRELPISRRAPDTKSEADIPLAVSFIQNGPAVPVPVPRIVTHSSSAPSSPPDSVFLSPTEAALPTRGRSPQCSPVSTTTGSYSMSSDSRSESRGRSSTRNSSFSDRERSGSRSSRGTSSPMGSISPTGSSIGIGGSYRGRAGGECRSIGRVYRRGSAGGEEERGRDRMGRKIGDSLSPPGLVGSPARAPHDGVPPYSPVLDTKLSSSSLSVSGSSVSAASISGSSVSGSSTASVATVTAHPAEDKSEHQGGHFKVTSVPSRISHIPIPSPIPEEEEQRSRQPTPANSPVRALASQSSPQSPASCSTIPSPTTPQHQHSPSAPPQVSPPPKSRLSEPVTSPSEAQATPSSPISRPESHVRAASDGQERQHPQHGTLIGRAAEIVQHARGLFGAIWNAV